MRGILVLFLAWLGIGFLREDREAYFWTSAEIAGKVVVFLFDVIAWIMERLFTFAIWFANADGNTQLLGAGLVIFTYIAWKLLCWNIERNLPPSTPWNEDDFDDFDEPPASVTQRKPSPPKSRVEYEHSTKSVNEPYRVPVKKTPKAKRYFIQMMMPGHYRYQNLGGPYTDIRAAERRGEQHAAAQRNSSEMKYRVVDQDGRVQ